MDVLCVGILVADVIAKPVTKMPARGQLERVGKIELHIGGCASNTGAFLSHLGVKVGVAGKVGQDVFGDFIVRETERRNVDTRGIIRAPNVGTACTMVLVAPDGERSFLHYQGANGELAEEDIDVALIDETKILHLAGFFLMPKLDGEPSARLLAQAKSMGKKTSLDVCWDSSGRWLSLVEPCLSHVDIFMPNLDEARMLSGKDSLSAMGDFSLSYGIQTLVIKMGPEGCYVRTRDSEYYLPPYRVDAVDATGAGDAFVVGFLTGIINDMTVKEAAKLGNAAGALCVSRMGAISGARDLKSTLNFMKEHGQ